MSQRESGVSAHVAERLMIAVPVLMAIWLVFMLSMQRAIQYDEAFTFMRYAQSPFIALFAYELPNNHLLHSFGVWIATTLMGDSLVAMRFVSVAAAVLCAAQVFRLTTRIGGAKAGALAAALLVVVPMWAEMVTNARGYTLSAFLTMIFVEQLYFSRLPLSIGEGRKLRAVSILLMLTLPTMALLTGSGCAWIIWRMRGSRYQKVVLMSVLPPIISGTLIGGIFYVSVFLYGDAAGSASRFGEANLITLITSWTTNVFGTLPSLALLMGAVVGVVVLWRKHRSLLMLFAFMVGLVIAVSLVQQMVTGRVFFARNFYYFIPLAALIGGVGLARALKFSPFAPTVAVVALLTIGALHSNTLNRPNTTSQFVDAFGEHAQAGDFVRIGCCMDFPVFYTYRDAGDFFNYTPDKTRVVFVPTSFNTLENLMTDAEQRARSFDRNTCQREIWGGIEAYTCEFTAGNAFPTTEN